MVGVRLLRTTAVTVGALGGLSSAAYGLLSEQSRRARRVIGIPEDPPLNADGLYLPDGSRPGDGLTDELTAEPAGTLRFAVLGDSLAAGVGADLRAQLPGVLLARELAEESGRPVRLRTFAISGATTPDIAGQVDRVIADRPELAMLIVGANDVTVKLLVPTSARLLGAQVARLTGAGITVVVGTCPDLGVIRPIPQPLRRVAGTWSRMLARAQRAVVLQAGGVPVPLADLLAPEFLARGHELFSKDQFHPNAAGYEAAAAVLLAPLCTAAGIWPTPVRSLPLRRSTPPLGLIGGSGPVGLAT